MKILSFVIAEEIIRDVDSDKITLVNVVEQLNAVSFPVFLSKCSAFLYLEREEEGDKEIEATVKFILNEKVLLNSPIKFSFKDKNRTRVLIKINGVVFNEEGNFKAELAIGEQKFTSYAVSLSLNKVETPKIAKPSVDISDKF